MGKVWRASHLDSDALVAVKVLSSPLSESSQLHRDFRGELGVIAGLNHPAIIQVYDGGMVTSTEAERSEGLLSANAPWFAMEYASRGTLERVSDWSRLEGAVRDILAGLAHAHARRVIHLDVKPTNVLEVALDHARPGWKLADFGISRLTDEDAARVVQGTPAFMAPEQIQGHQHLLGPWTDLYSLGCAVWLLVCGKKPYPGRNAKQIGLAHLSGARLPYRPRYRVPRYLEVWLGWLMARAPSRRPQFASDALEALDELGEVIEPRSARAADTVSTFSTQGQLTTFEFMAPAVEEEEFSEELPIHFGQAPMPFDWRLDDLEFPRRDWEMGLGVHDLREVPFVGREAERDTLWAALRKVKERGRPQAVFLQGATGCGKSRLAAWLAERAVEVGAASAVFAHHSRRGGPTDGIGAAVGRALGLHKIGPEASLDYLSGHPGVADDLEAHLLQSLMHHDAPLVSAVDRHMPLVRMLTHFSLERAVVLVVDDAQWGPEGLVVVQRLMRQPKARVLVVATVRQEALAERPDTADILESLLDSPGTVAMSLEPLPAADHRTLVERLLPLEPMVAERLYRRTLGNPLFAVQLVGDWVKRRLLVPGPDGFTIRPGADLALPDSLHMAWSERLDRLFASLGEATRTAVELAACLGQHVDLMEWRATCTVAGIEASSAVVQALLDSGLARKTDTGFAFVHGILRESIERAAREAGRAGQLHRCCADAFWDVSPRSRQRQAKHRIAAGDLVQALAPLLEASAGYEIHGDLEASRAAYFEWEETARAIDLAETEALWLQGVLRRSGIEQAHGRFGKARELALHVAVRGTASEPMVVQALRVAGEAALRQGDLNASIKHLERARDRAMKSKMLDETAFSAMGLAEALLLKGQRAEAEEALDAARQRITRGAMPYRHVQLLRALAFLSLHHAHFEESQERLEEALGIAEKNHLRIGIGLCQLGLGDVRRLAGDLGAASRNYEQAMHVLRPAGPLRVAQVHLGQASNALAGGSLARAEGLAQAVRAQFSGFERRRELAIADGVSATVACLRRERDALDQVRAYFGAMQAYGSGEPDLVWLLTRCGEAVVSLDPKLGEALLERAVGGWRSLGWTREVSRLERVLADEVSWGE